MMDFCLIYEDETGYCRVIKPCEKFQQKTETDQSAVYRASEMSLPDQVEFIKCSSKKVPEDKTFRDAWKKGDINEPIKIDLERAIEIHRCRLREACQLKIYKLKEQLELEMEKGNIPAQNAIHKTKQILRNLHEMNLSHCKTPEDVKWSIPKELHDVWTYYAMI